ncbi:malate:quinone oxidoreductase, partial [Agrobacterium sp. S2]|nr:malate:quinone oxidoreductase [Agrobacterium sp. S2]
MAVTPIDQDKSQLTDLSEETSLSHALPMNRRQVLGGALAGLAAAALPSSALLANTTAKKVDVLLIGGGIMSATLGVWLR